MIPRLRDLAGYLDKANLDGIPDGTYDLGDGVRAIVQSYEAKQPETAHLEAHRRFIDLQYIAAGEEKIGYAPIERAGSPVAPFDETKDIVFLDGAYETLTLRAGDFAIFLPSDAHAPGIRAGAEPMCVRKVVVKIPVELIR